MDWSQELLISMRWLAQAYCIAAVLFVMTLWGLVKTTRWGRQFWSLTGAYFFARQGRKPLALLALILLLTLASVRISLLLSAWYNEMYTALQKLNIAFFWTSMIIFAILATLHVVRAVFNQYVSQVFSLQWRIWLNERLLSQWLEERAYYRTLYLAKKDEADNPDQRLQQDVASLVGTSLSFAMGSVSALVSIFSYTLILWHLSGVLTLGEWVIPRGMVFAVFIYVLIATVIAFKIGRPLVWLNFLSERLNADYRYALVRVREYAESIAFYYGERVEGSDLRGRFSRLINNAWQIVYRSLKFQGFNLAVSQTAVVFPFIIQAKRFFAQQITLGDMVQTAQAFGTLHDNLSFFRNAYDDFAAFRAGLNRLTGFVGAIEHANALPVPQVCREGERMALENFSVLKPNGEVLLDRLSIEITPGMPLLIRGPSGVGKTTLLRALAGFWPYCAGQFVRPDASLLFLAQKPYLPLGSLRSALYYPQSVPEHAEQDARQALIDVQLGHLCERLDEEGDWGKVLSIGEQQRLAFGRALLAKPRAIFLDEATSAMDEGLEDAMYRLMIMRLSSSAIVSVAHRSTLRIHHPQQLELIGEGQWKWAVSLTGAG